MRDPATLKSVPLSTLTDEEIQYLHDHEPEWWNAQPETLPSGEVWLVALLDGPTAEIAGERFPIPEGLRREGRQMCLARIRTGTQSVEELRGPFMRVDD